MISTLNSQEIKPKGGKDMATTIKARFSHGVLTPLERVDFPEGAEVSITIARLNTPKKNLREVLASTCGAWADLDTEALKRNIYADREISTRPVPKL